MKRRLFTDARLLKVLAGACLVVAATVLTIVSFCNQSVKAAALPLTGLYSRDKAVKQCSKFKNISLDNLTSSGDSGDDIIGCFGKDGAGRTALFLAQNMNVNDFKRNYDDSKSWCRLYTDNDASKNNQINQYTHTSCPKLVSAEKEQSGEQEEAKEQAGAGVFYDTVCGKVEDLSSPMASSQRSKCVANIDTAYKNCNKKTDVPTCIYDRLASGNNLGLLLGLSRDDAIKQLEAAWSQSKEDQKEEEKKQKQCLEQKQYSSCSTSDLCSQAGGNWEAGACNSPTGVTTTTSNACKQATFGWVLCPLSQGLGSLVDGAYSLVSGTLLEIDSLNIFQGSAFSAYKMFLPIANIMLAIMFLLIIYSEATGNGFGALSNYSIKKLLPKLVVYAILVNVSWWICAAAVDISNILGANLTSMFGKTADSLQQAIGPTAGWASLALMAIAGAGGLYAIASMALFLPLAICALVAIAIVFLLIILRNSLIILLCVIAPIAIVLALLPNTTKWYKQWFNTLLSILLVYPTVSLLFGACRLASSLMTSAGSGFSDFVMDVAAAAVSVIPLLAAPYMVIKLIGAVPGIGGTVAGMASKAMKSRTNKTKQAAKRGYRDSGLRRRVNKAKGAVARGYLQTPMGRHDPTAALRLAASGGLADEEADKETMKRATDMLGVYSIGEQKIIAKTGKDVKGNNVDVNVWRAAIREHGEKFDYDDNVTFANALHDFRERKKKSGLNDEDLDLGRDGEFTLLQKDALEAIKKSKHSMVPGSKNIHVARGNAMLDVSEDATAWAPGVTPAAAPAASATPPAAPVAAGASPAAAAAAPASSSIIYREEVIKKLDSVSAQQFDSSDPAAVGSFIGGAAMALSGRATAPGDDEPDENYERAKREASAHVLDAAIDSMDRSQAGLTKPMPEKKQDAMQQIVDDGVKGKTEELAADKSGEKLARAISETTADGRKSQLDRLRDDQLAHTSDIKSGKKQLDKAQKDMDMKLAETADNYLSKHANGAAAATAGAVPTPLGLKVQSEMQRIRHDGTERRMNTLHVSDMTTLKNDGSVKFNYQKALSMYQKSGLGNQQQFDKVLYQKFARDGGYKGNATDRNLDAAMRKMQAAAGGP